MNIGPAIKTALLAESSITDLLGVFLGTASIHTRRPVPASAGLPLVVSSDDVAITDQDFVSKQMAVITRDVSIYGEAQADYRAVERLGYLIRDLFHRDRFSLTVSGYQVVDIEASGPRIAPTSDDKLCGRVVTLTVRLKPTS